MDMEALPISHIFNTPNSYNYVNRWVVEEQINLFKKSWILIFQNINGSDKTINFPWIFCEGFDSIRTQKIPEQPNELIEFRVKLLEVKHGIRSEITQI